MPVGPQHGSGGSRGSFGGGGRVGGSFGGGYSRSTNVFVFGGGSSGNIGAPREPIDSKLAESYNKKNKINIWIPILAFVLFFMMIASIVTGSSARKNQDKIDIMNSDAEYYSNLIATGDRVEADIVSYYYYMTYNGVDYYYVKYTALVGGKYVKGETYAQFTYADINSMARKINITVDSDGYSMNTSWKKENAEYLYTQDELQAQKTTNIVCIVITCLLGVALALVIVKAVRVNKEENAKIKARREELKKEKENEGKPKVNKCKYCGTTVQEGTHKCPSCGASI